MKLQRADFIIGYSCMHKQELQITFRKRRHGCRSARVMRMDADTSERNVIAMPA